MPYRSLSVRANAYVNGRPVQLHRGQRLSLNEHSVFLFSFSPATCANPSTFVEQRFKENGEWAADVVLVVDESNSMEGEHRWTFGMCERLETALLRKRIGVSKPNLFALVGYGKAEYSLPYGYLAHTFTSYDARTLVPFFEFISTLVQLHADVYGSVEDGYQAMDHALKNIPFRTTQNVARIMILISDEDRDVTPEGFLITRALMQNQLWMNHTTLHVVVDNTFTANGKEALGVDSEGHAFLQVDFEQFIAANGAEIGPGYEGTLYYYTSLALALNGTAWDINILRKGGATSEVFSKAVTSVLASETHLLGTECQQCGYEGSYYLCRTTTCTVGLLLN